MLHSAFRWLSLSLAILFFSTTVSLQFPKPARAVSFTPSLEWIALPDLELFSDDLESLKDEIWSQAAVALENLGQEVTQTGLPILLTEFWLEGDLSLEQAVQPFCAAVRGFASVDDASRIPFAFLESSRYLWVVVSATQSASVAGAGPLTRYAGLASTVSKLGLTGAITKMARLLGSRATGSAATAVVVRSVGGPTVMTVMLLGLPPLFALSRQYLRDAVMPVLEPWANDICGSAPINASAVSASR